MHIKQITIKNFRCFDNLTFTLNPDINIFVGNNGSGKSAVLDAIAAAMYPYIEAIQSSVDRKKVDRDIAPIFKKDLRVSNKPNSTTELFASVTHLPSYTAIYKPRYTDYADDSLDTDYQQHLINSNSKFFNDITDYANILINNSQSQLFVVAYYKGDRNFTNVTNIQNPSNHFTDRFDGLKNTLNASANFTDLANWFFIRRFHELNEVQKRGDLKFELSDLKQIRKAISTIIAPNVNVYFAQNTSSKLMVEWETETGEKIELSLNQLSSGYRNMLALVMDFARRLAQANPQMENPLEAEAVLMIDELDLHLHPTWQQKIIPDLRKVFPNTQIIATTHSPEIVTTVERHQVKILENYQIKECPTPTRGRSSSDIVRDVLGLEKLRPDTEESRTLTALFDAIDNGNLEGAKQLRDKLQDWEHFDPDLIRADMQIHRLQRKVNA